MKTDMAQYMRERRRKRREQLINNAGSVYSRCGSTKDLEFDHRDRNSKLFVLSGKALDKPFNLLLEEVAKCDLLCSSCHLEKTREAKDNIVWRKPAKECECGTARGYWGGCRCPECKLAKSQYRKGLINFTERFIGA